ncbi:MAG: hypothetical protein RIQ54_245 [Candidatus Parcubacteria bacterium]
MFFVLALASVYSLFSFFIVSAAGDFVLSSTPVSYQAQQASFSISPSFISKEEEYLSYVSRASTLPTGVSVRIASSTASSTPVIVSYGPAVPPFFFVTIDASSLSGIRHSISVPISVNSPQITFGSSASSTDDFLFVAQPSALSVGSYATTSFSVTAIPITGDLSPVDLRIEPVATVFTDVSLSNQEITAAHPTAVVTVSTRQVVSSGLYPISIVATNRFGISHAITVPVTVAGVNPGSYSYVPYVFPGVASSTAVSTTSLAITEPLASSAVPFSPKPIACRRLVYVLHGVNPQATASLIQAVGRGDIVILRPFRFDTESLFDPEFAALVSKLQGLGAIVYVSIDGQYGFSDLATTYATVDLLQDWYRVDGVAVYNVATAPDRAAFFNAVASHIRYRNLSPIFVFSGYPSHAFYAPVIDYALFEHFTISDADNVPSSDFFQYPEEKRITLIHSVGSQLDLAISVSAYTPFIAVTQGSPSESLASLDFFSQARELLSRRCTSAPLSAVTATSSPQALLLRLQILLKHLLVLAGL